MKDHICNYDLNGCSCRGELDYMHNSKGVEHKRGARPEE